MCTHSKVMNFNCISIDNCPISIRDNFDLTSALKVIFSVLVDFHVNWGMRLQWNARNAKMFSLKNYLLNRFAVWVFWVSLIRRLKGGFTLSKPFKWQFLHSVQPNGLATLRNSQMNFNSLQLPSFFTISRHFIAPLNYFLSFMLMIEACQCVTFFALINRINWFCCDRLCHI